MMTLLNLLSKNIETIYPLTPVQQGMLFHTLMQPNSGVYLQQYRYIMTMDNLDVPAFEQAWQAVVERHQVLRSAFVHETQDQALQVVFKQLKLPFTYLDWRNIDKAQQQEKIEHFLAQERAQGLPFNQAPLMRVMLIQLEDNRYQFIRSYHHILMDAWCFSLIMVEFLQFYRHFTQRKILTLTPVSQYQDYITWLSKNNNQQVELEFWQQNLAGFSEPTSLGITQTNRFSNKKHSVLSKDVVCQFSSIQSEKLQRIASQYQVTLNTLTQGAWAQTLARYSDQTDIVFGITVAGRSIELAGIENIVGLFINTLPLRCSVKNTDNLGKWLQTLQQDNLALRDFEQTSLALIQQWSEVEDQPLFNSIFVYENTPMDKALDLDALEFSVDDAQNRSNLNYPLTVTVLPKDTLQLELTYRCSDFETQSVEAMLDYFKQLLVNVCELPLPQQATLVDIEPTCLPQKNNRALIGDSVIPLALATQLFSEIAQKQPQQKAVTFGQQTLSYAELDKKSNALAHYLITKHNIKADTLIGLCITPSSDMLVAILGILKAGAAYVPLDPDYPIARLEYMIDDAQLRLIISQQALASHPIFSQAPERLLSLDCDRFNQKLADFTSDVAPDIHINEHDLAYVIYTSGTTGKPKGVMVEHQQLSNFLSNVKQRYNITPCDKILQFSTINFDISIEECFGALCFGAELVIRDDDCISDPVKFFDFCQQHEISVISLPTAFWHQLVSYPHKQIAQSLRLVIVGGEALQLNLVNHWFNHFNGVELVNTYGPTEATVTASGYHLTGAFNDFGEIPIGQANLNTELYVLDKQLRQVPLGTIGELYIGGQSITRGYLHQENLTAASFIQSPFDSKMRLYRTGDLVRLNHNNQLEFNGRVDDQVKIRGYRIELAEIETVIQQQPGIKQCIVTAWTKENGDKALAAYFTCEQPQNINLLHQVLSELLTNYMRPSALIELTELPLTANGKVNKKALPNPELHKANIPATNYVEASNEIEHIIISSWRTILGTEKISINDNFFSLGGHSLLVIQVLAALRKKNIIIDATQLFKTPTPKTLAAAISLVKKQSHSTSEITGNLIPADSIVITDDMLPLLSLEQHQIDNIVKKVPQGISNIQDIYPLAPLQEGILFHHMLSPKNDPYIVKALLEINNSDIFERFIAGLNFVIQRHDILRTSILWRQLDKPVQLVNRHANIAVEWLTFDETSITEDNNLLGEKALKKNVFKNNILQNMLSFQAQQNLELNLETGPLLKIQVAKDPNTDQHAVMFIEHHIISDHISVDIIMKELTAFLTDNIDELKPSIPYRHFVHHALQQNSKQAQQYFTQELGNIHQATLPYGLANTQSNASNIQQQKFDLNNQLANSIRKLCKLHQVSPASFFHSAWALVVARASANSQIVFGTVMSGRLQNIEDADAMLGLFINTLPIKIKLTSLNAQQLLANTRNTLQALIPHEQSALAMVQRCSQVSGDQPLFSALLNYRHSTINNNSSNETLAGIKLLSVAEPSNYPFTLSVDDYGSNGDNDDGRSDNFSLTLEIDKTISCQQIHHELMTVINLLSEQLTSADEEPILNLYLKHQSQQLSLIETSDWQTPDNMVFTEIDVEQEGYQPVDIPMERNETQPISINERLLAEIWQKVLAIDTVGRFDNFFALGGHSLLIMQVITALQQRDIELSASQLFKTPVLADLALEIAKASKANDSVKPAFSAIPQKVTKITPEMLPLISLQQQEIDLIVEQIPGGIANLQDVYPLAPLQQGILFHHRIDEQQDPYVMPAYLKIDGTDNFQQFTDALNHIIERHDTLRTAILWRNLSQPVQVVYRQAKLPVTWLQLDPEQDLLEQMQALDEQQQLSINIEQAPLLNITVARKPHSDKYVIRILDHHIISDHVSMDIVQQELAIIFTGNKIQLPAPVQYREFIAQCLSQQQQQQQAAEQFFKSKLSGFYEPGYPFTLSHKNNVSLDIGEQDSWLSSDLSAEIRQQAKRFKLNPATLFHSAFAMVLAACSNKTDIVFGTVMSGRLQGVKGTESMLGMFINTLPLRINLEQINAGELILQTQQALQALIPYEQTALSEVQQYSELSAETPLFNTLLNYRHTVKKPTDNGNNLSQLKFIDPKERTNYPFAISIDDYGDDFLINTQVDASLNVDRISGYLITALAQLINQLKSTQQKNILQCSVLPLTEQKTLLHLDQHKVDYPQDCCIYQLFEQQAQLSADKIALIYNDNELTYQSLDEKSNQLARYLIAQGVKHNEYVALFMDRSFDLVIAIWAILKSGAAYLPIDVSLPKARINTIITDSKTNILLSQQHLIDHLSDLSLTIFSFDSEDSEKTISHLPSHALTREVLQSPMSSAYLIYTSGSTGEPKGVVCSHQGLINRIDWMQKQYQLTTEDKVLQKTPYNFDVSVWEFVWPLIVGATLVIAKPEGHKDARYLTSIIQQQQITHLHFVPSMLNLMLSIGDWRNCRSVKKVFCSGEALSYELQQIFFANRFYGQTASCQVASDQTTSEHVTAELHNLYGPTEASIDVSYWQCQPKSNLNLVPIGKPIQNTQLLILDSHKKLVPFGAEGELYIGGVGLAQGYLNKPGLTAERFIDNPFNDDSLTDSCFEHSDKQVTPALPDSEKADSEKPNSEKIYRTGDLVRYLPDGNIEYLGRLDDQVKIHGLRIELGEIEFILNQHTEINSVQITLKPDQKGEQHLVAYLKTTSQVVEQALLIGELKLLLATQLPSYMVPEHYQFIEQWPLSTNGKIDKKLLPEPEFIKTCGNIIAPVTPEQRKLLIIWAELLVIEPENISIDSNFFELGGHSILAMKLISAIETEFNLSLPLNSLFSSPTIMTIAGQISEEQSEQNDEVNFMEQLLNEFEAQE